MLNALSQTVPSGLASFRSLQLSLEISHLALERFDYAEIGAAVQADLRPERPHRNRRNELLFVAERCHW